MEAINEVITFYQGKIECRYFKNSGTMQIRKEGSDGMHFWSTCSANEKAKLILEINSK